MHERVEARERGRVGEHAFGDAAAIDGARTRVDVGPVLGDQCGAHLGVVIGDLVAESIAIDHACAALGERARDRALAGAGGTDEGEHERAGHGRASGTAHIGGGGRRGMEVVSGHRTRCLRRPPTR